MTGHLSTSSITTLCWSNEYEAGSATAAQRRMSLLTVASPSSTTSFDSGSRRFFFSAAYLSLTPIRGRLGQAAW